MHHVKADDGNARKIPTAYIHNKYPLAEIYIIPLDLAPLIEFHSILHIYSTLLPTPFNILTYLLLN